MKKLDNRGLSLVELIIAIAMSTIVVGAAAMFLYNAERSYRIAEYSVDLQMEAQLLMEQMSNWVMESNYAEIEGAGSILILYKLPRNDVDDSLNAVGVKGERKILYVNNGKMFMKVDKEDTPGDFLTEIENGTLNLDFTMAPMNEEDVVGEYVETFLVTLPTGIEDTRIHSISVELGMHEGVSRQSQSYTVTNIFSMRNGYALDED